MFITQDSGCCRRGSRALDYFNRVIVLSSTIGTTFVGLLFQNFLGLRISEAKKQFVTALASDIMILIDHTLRNFAAFEPEDIISPKSWIGLWEYLPRKPDFLADPCLFVTADLLGYYTVWLKVAT